MLKKIKKKIVLINMFSDKTQMLIILVMAVAHILISGMMVVASFTSKDKGMKKCGGIWIISLIACAVILTFSIMQYKDM